MKKCPTCPAPKFLSEFGKDRSQKDGHSIRCKECAKDYRNAYWVANAERKNIARRQERQENIGKFRLLDQKRYERDKERILERMAKEYETDPTRQKKNAAIRRARKLNQFVEPIDPATVYQMHGGMCGICKEFVARNEFEVDHIIPLSKGGLHGYANVQPAHFKCNRSKGAKIL